MLRNAEVKLFINIHKAGMEENRCRVSTDEDDDEGGIGLT